MKWMMGFVMIVVISACGNPPSNQPAGQDVNTLSGDEENSIDLVGADMREAHEGPPHGLPQDWDWGMGPRVNLGTSPPATCRAVTPWGQLYEAAYGNPARNTRVEIRDMALWILNRRHVWRRADVGVELDGKSFREDFSGTDPSQDDLIRQGSSLRVSISPGAGYCYHFWTIRRDAIDPSDIAGIFATVRARLVTDDESLPDDRENARYLLSMGADYYQNTTDTNGCCDDVAIGRFKYVKTGWRSFNMTTLSPSELLLDPPPLD